MPHYDYLCTHCGHREEILQKITDAPLKECPQCKKSTFKRQFGAGIGLQFQGTGFYQTDYNKTSAPPEKPDSKSDSKPNSKPDSGCGCGKSSCSK